MYILQEICVTTGSHAWCHITLEASWLVMSMWFLFRASVVRAVTRQYSTCHSSQALPLGGLHPFRSIHLTVSSPCLTPESSMCQFAADDILFVWILLLYTLSSGYLFCHYKRNRKSIIILPPLKKRLEKSHKLWRWSEDFVYGHGLSSMKKAEEKKEKQVCGAACFIATKNKFSEDVHYWTSIVSGFGFKLTGTHTLCRYQFAFQHCSSINTCLKQQWASLWFGIHWDRYRYIIELNNIWVVMVIMDLKTIAVLHG